MKDKFVVYTAIFGNYDDLIDPKENYEGCDFICFTDQKHLKSDIWEIRLIEECDLAPNMMNRKYKILPHLFLSEYEWSMYADANIKILNNPFDLATKYLTKHDFVMPKHFARNCVYEEAKECVILGKTKYDETKKQMDSYRKDGFPEKFGLGENNILFRKHNNEKVIKIMTDWWEELNTQTKRDQLSFAYVLWKNGEDIKTSFDDKIFLNSHNDCIDKMMAIDYKTYQIDDILTKVDRATMSVSLEGREPLLDHRIIEFVSQLPSSYKIKDGNKKYILKSIVYDYIPKELMDRPKMGFSIPLNEWFGDELKKYVLEYLDNGKVAKTGLLNAAELERLRKQWLQNSSFSANKIWLLLTFMMWHERWVG